MGFDEFFAAFFRIVKHCVQFFPAEGIVFGSTLDFDEFSSLGHDDIEVNVGAGVFFIGEIEAHMAVDNANRYRRYWGEERVSGDDALGCEVGNGVGKCDIGAGDAGGAGAAVGLQHITVNVDRIFPQ